MRKFSPEERGIFSYFDPDKASPDSPDGMVFADPFEIESRWHSAKINQKTDIEVDFKNLDLKAEGFDPEGDEPDPFEDVKRKSLSNLLPFIHAVFETNAFSHDGSGITFEEAFENLERWMNFSIEVKKNTDEVPNMPTSSPEPTEKLPSGKNTLGSMSTKPASSRSGHMP
jgi:hypothetical protein